MGTEEFYDEIINYTLNELNPILAEITGPNRDQYHRNDPLVIQYRYLRDKLDYYQNKKLKVIKQEQEEDFKRKLSKAADLIIKHFGEKEIFNGVSLALQKL